MLEQRTRPLASGPAAPTVDTHRYLAWRGAQMSLSPSEVRILHALINAGPRVVGRAELAKIAETDVRRGLDAHMYRLRHKLLEMPGLTLETVPKRGFRLLVCSADA